MSRTTHEPADANFGQRFRHAWRNSKLRDLNQKQLAKRYDYSQQGISSISNGHRYPHLSKGIQMAKDFEVTLDYLYTGRLPMRPVDPSPFVDLGYRLTKLNQDQFRVVDSLVGLLNDHQVSTEAVQAALLSLFSGHLNKV
jgi:transcriptional regulator with XRE-family HTH domain